MSSIFKKYFYFSFSYLNFWTVLALHCCPRRPSLVAVCRLLVVASAIYRRGSRRVGFSSCGSQAPRAGLGGCVLPRTCCLAACEIFPDQEFETCSPPQWQWIFTTLDHHFTFLERTVSEIEGRGTPSGYTTNMSSIISNKLAVK